MKIKKGGMIAACVGAALIISVAGFIYNNPFKVTNPTHPSFNPMEFRFEDYWGEREVNKALKQMFPMGTPKSEIDKVFLNSMKLKESNQWSFDEETGQIGLTDIEGHYAVYYSSLDETGDEQSGRFVVAIYSTDTNTLTKNLNYQKLLKNNFYSKGSQGIVDLWHIRGEVNKK